MIDSAEWAGPYDDQELGFNKIAPHYMYPGWWECGPQTSAYASFSKWNELPGSYRRIIEAASANAQTWTVSKYDAENPKALRWWRAARAAAVADTHHGVGVRCIERHLCRAVGEVPEVQEGLRQMAAFPERGGPVVPRG